MHAKLHPERELDHALAACKAWPAYPGRSIVVLPLVNSSSPKAQTRTLDLEVLVIQRPDNGNTERDAVLARIYQSEALEEDAIRIQDLRIDTARYVLNSDVRAFGVRVRYQGSSRPNPFASETLRLYAPQGARLREVLEEIEIDQDSTEWDLRCNGHSTRLRTLVSVGQAPRNGFAELSLSRTLTHTRTQLQQDGLCEERTQAPQHSKFTLAYDGNRYPVPKALRNAP